MVTFALQQKSSQTQHNLSDKHVIQDAVSINIGRIISGIERNGIRDEICQFNPALCPLPCKKRTLEFVYPSLLFVF